MTAAAQRTFVIPFAGTPSEQLRRGYRGVEATSAHINTLLASIGSHQPAPIRYDSIVKLRKTLQQVLLHPTLQTLKDAFTTSDRILTSARKLQSAKCLASEPGAQVRLAVYISGLLAGLTEVESGLERIELLPASAPDYPDED